MHLVLTFAALAYAAALFYLAWRTDRSPNAARWVDQPIGYALALSVYCTSWTFFGAVGAAATSGWTYLPIYLGPICLFLFGQPLLRRIAEIAQRENITSIADFISSRYGKSRSVAALVTLIATLAILPYIALQLKSIGMSASAMLHAEAAKPPAPPALLVAFIAAALALFASMFGARRYEASGAGRGLLAAVSVEGIVKLAALTLVGIYAAVLLFSAAPADRTAGLQEYSRLFSLAALQPNFLTITVLSMGAILCLPRQFYVGFVKYRSESDLKAAHWGMPIYLGITALVIVPITISGLALLPKTAPADLYVLDLPLAHQAQGIALLAFLGGFSAATGMVIVECVAVSTMISNDLIAPFLLRKGAAEGTDYGAQIVLARRIAIAGILALAFVVYLGIDQRENLASLGLVAFAAAAQFAPSLLGAIYWKKGTARGVRLGLVAGALCWAYTLLLPSVLGADGVHGLGLSTVLGGALDPQGLLGLKALDPLTHGVVWSVGLNTLLFVAGSTPASDALARRLRAAVNYSGAFAARGGAKTNSDLLSLADRFVGAGEAQHVFAAAGVGFEPQAPVTPQSALLTERLIAQVIGAPSARLIVDSAMKRGALEIADVAVLIDETKQALQFSRELLAATLDNISQGISVIDQDLRLIAWNQAYLNLFSFPPGFIKVGLPIAEVIRFNAERGEFGDFGAGGVEEHIERRLAALRRRAHHTYERERPNGTVLKSIGNPMPGGGYVTSFTDITAEKAAQAALQEANEQLEGRVAERTAELSEANAELSAAKNTAEAATLSKTKFLAAASHDLLQPLNAARLFSAALEDSLSTAPQSLTLVRSIERSIAAADNLLRALLDMSRLEAGGVTPKIEVFPLDNLLSDLAAQFAPLAAAKGLQVRYERTSLWIASDRSLLRSTLQNFLSNAVRYTHEGRVLLGARRKGGRVAIEVWDTGPGIPESHRKAIFEEFRRFNKEGEESGAGLGLSIVDRVARALNAQIDLKSALGRGSVFSIDAPIAAPNALSEAVQPASGQLEMSVLCVDNEPEILDGLAALLSGWGATPICAGSYSEALAAMDLAAFDAAIIDWHLGEAYDGMDVARAWRRECPGGRFVVITASADDALEREVQELGGALLRKPVAAQDLRRFLAALEPVS